MVHPALNTITTAAPSTPPTYGELFADAVTALGHARAHGVGPFDTAMAAADTVADYERFLAITGRHLQLLLAPTPAVSTRDAALPRRLGGDLARLRLDRRGGNDWARASDALGLAHDVLATHVGPHGELRSPEAIVMTSPEVQRAAVDRVVHLVGPPLTDASLLLRRARATQPMHDPPMDPEDAKRVRLTAARATKLLAKPSVVVDHDNDLVSRLDRLPPVQTKLDENTPARVLQSISTLHLLRQLTMRQSQGEEAANAHSLQELCRLAVATCRAAEATLPYAATPLGRVDRAATLDHLHRAATLWGELGGRLYPRIHGLTKAPGLYHLAITRVTEEATTNPVATRAILSCLPRLAFQSSTTVNYLQHRYELVANSRAPGDLVSRWRPLSPAEARDLAEAFVAAGRATRRASDAVRRQFDPVTRRAATPGAQVAQRSRGLEAER